MQLCLSETTSALLVYQLEWPSCLVASLRLAASSDIQPTDLITSAYHGQKDKAVGPSNALLLVTIYSRRILNSTFSLVISHHDHS